VDVSFLGAGFFDFTALRYLPAAARFLPIPPAGLVTQELESLSLSFIFPKPGCWHEGIGFGAGLITRTVSEASPYHVSQEGSFPVNPWIFDDGLFPHLSTKRRSETRGRIRSAPGPLRVAEDAAFLSCLRSRPTLGTHPGRKVTPKLISVFLSIFFLTNVTIICLIV
jgi:hypothetical protein